MSLLQELKNWDGKTINKIEKVYKDHYENASFVDELLPLIKKSDLQKGSTWILKKYLESDGALKENEQEEIFSLLSRLEHWETKK